MIGTALFIHYARTTTLQELQVMLLAIFGSGLPGLFLLGFLTTRARSLPSLAAMLLMLAGVAGWVWLGSDMAAVSFPGLRERLPHLFWLYMFSNVFVFAVGYLLSLLPARRAGDRPRDLPGLTVWTREDRPPAKCRPGSSANGGRHE